MTQSGGPAAINGFLYQIIQHLGWIAGIALSKVGPDQEFGDVRLVLEPRTGGDARVETGASYTVEQYKTRKGGTWAMADIKPVLRDLRKSVPAQNPSRACYRFVTDGRPGLLDPLQQFLDRIRSSDGLADLDSTVSRSFGSEFQGTDREFFGHVCEISRSSPGIADSNENDLVWHLMSNFEMEFEVSGDAKAQSVEAILRNFAPNLGDEKAIRQQLVGILMDTLSKGEARLGNADIDRMFREADLNPERMRKLGRLSQTLAAVTSRRISHLGYVPDRDVRQPANWPDGKPVLLIAGDSGSGKTWQLAQLLKSHAGSDQPAVLVGAAAAAEHILARVARDVWQSGLGETSDKTLGGISNFMREWRPGNATPWLIIAVDDVQSVDLARELARQDWEDWGIRLVMTVPRATAQTLQLSDSQTAHIHWVGDFSVDELDLFLSRHGKHWSELPSDLKKLLRKPILAGLFIDLPYTSAKTAPRSEYEIFEGFWRRTSEKGRMGDEGIVLALAGHFQKGGTYPLPRSRWSEIGLGGSDELTRLDASGWLRSTMEGEIAFSHDRLLNWAIAKYLAHQFREKRLSVQSLGDALALEDHNAGQRLGYIMMDVFWLLAEDHHNVEALQQLLVRLEEGRRFGSYGEDAYKGLLPTLGDRAIPLLLARLSTFVTTTDKSYQIGLVGKAFAALAGQQSVDLSDVVAALISSPSPGRQDVAIAILSVAPDRKHLDRLWELHQQRLRSLDANSERSSHADYRAGLAAMKAGVAAEPEWLRQRILTADGHDIISALGYLLHGLDHPSAKTIWAETKETLFRKMPDDKPRSLLYCVARFADHEKLDFVVAHLKRVEDFANGSALNALSVLDPLAAINRLADVGESERSLVREQWLPNLLNAHPDLTRQRILELANTSPRQRRVIEDIFWDRPDDMDASMLSLILRMLERDLREHIASGAANDPNWLYHPLDFIGRIVSPALIAILQQEAGGDLEQMIVEIAWRRLDSNSDYLDHIKENARRVLILMGGDGVTKLINRELRSEHFWVRHSGMNWAVMRQDSEIVERLSVIASRRVPRDEDHKPDSEPYREFYQSVSVLAALGADAALVHALWSAEIAQAPVDLADLRAHRGPMPENLTQRASETLQNPASTELDLLLSLLVAWVSDDKDFIPLARAILKAADPNSKVALYACNALQALEDGSDEFVSLAERLIQTEAKTNVAWGLSALLNLRELGLLALERWLRANISSLEPRNDQVIRALYGHAPTRQLAIDAAVVRCRSDRHLFSGPYDIAAETNNTELRDRILDKAFAEHSFVTTAPLHAIEGLAKYDVARTVQAIELAIGSHPKIERELCLLLVKFAPEQAAEKLVTSVMASKRDGLCSAVGRALRQLDQVSVERALAAHLRGSMAERKAIAELGGWVQIPSIDDALRSMAGHDESNEVRHAALHSLYQQRQESSLRQHLAAFSTASHDHRWGLITMILETADPYLMTTRDDPLWLGQILSDEVPYAFVDHAETVLRRRKQKLQ